MFKAVFISPENAAEYSDAVLTWLQSDYIQKDSPDRHFWHNRSIITHSFNECQAMVVLKDNKEVVGYMIWSAPSTSAEIDIIEVKERYRRQGLCKLMESEFLKRFTDVCVFTGSVIPESEEIFLNAGWVSILDLNRLKKFYKIVRPVLNSMDVLPNGRVIAVCSVNFYQVKQNREKYRASMKYFQIDLTEDNQLVLPIVTDFHYEGYVAVYYNQELLIEGKAKHIFKAHNCVSNLLILGSIEPNDPQLFYQKGFLSQPEEVLSEEVSEAGSFKRQKSPTRSRGFFAVEAEPVEDDDNLTERKKAKADPSAPMPQSKK